LAKFAVHATLGCGSDRNVTVHRDGRATRQRPVCVVNSFFDSEAIHAGLGAEEQSLTLLLKSRDVVSREVKRVGELGDVVVKSVFEKPFGWRVRNTRHQLSQSACR
jgi:hypothetical protein